MAKYSLILVLARHCKCFVFSDHAVSSGSIFLCDGDKCASIYANNLHLSVHMYAIGGAPVTSCSGHYRKVRL